MSDSSSGSSSSNNAERSDLSSSVTELSASVAVQSPPTSTETIKSTVATIDNSVTTKEEQKVETAQVPTEHNGEENPLVQCRCGCVPKNMMSLFQMAEKRARYQEEKRRKETEAAAQNLPQGRM